MATKNELIAAILAINPMFNPGDMTHAELTAELKRLEAQEDDLEAQEVELVTMVHLDTAKSAEVHPDEVDNYYAGGYRKAGE